jgi:L-ascorbate metabolism protein UlaG (beta-lactamase superfamily)
MALIRPALQDDAFLDDVETAMADTESLHLWWLGQSGFLVAWGGRRLLLDPYLSESLTHKYAATDKPHVRITERVLDPARLTGISLVTSSHVHTDHLDPETLRPLSTSNPELRMVFPEAIRAAVAQRSGLADGHLHGLDADYAGRPGKLGTPDRLEIDGFHIQAVPAAHEALDTDAAGRLICLGFVIQIGPWTLYHSGDTVSYPGQEALLRPMRIDLALLPINGRSPERRVSGNLWGREAARLARAIGATTAIPCHYDLFEFNTATPEEFVMNCQQVGQGYRILRAGERWTLDRP